MMIVPILVLSTSKPEAPLRRREHVASRFFKTLEQRLGIGLELRKRFPGRYESRLPKAVPQVRKLGRQAGVGIDSGIDFKGMVGGREHSREKGKKCCPYLRRLCQNLPCRECAKYYRSR